MATFFIVYILILAVSIIDLSIGIKQANQIRIVLLLFCGSLILLIAGLRWDVGTDWSNYQGYYSFLKILPIFQSGFEVGYELFARFIHSFFPDNYTAMLFSTALIIILFTYTNTLRYSPFPIFSIFLLFSYSINSSGFGYRQDIAIAILFWSFQFIEKRKLILFVITIVIAMTFHQTAIAFLPAYWIYKIKWKALPIMIVLGCLIIFLIGLSNINTIINAFGTDMIVEKTQIYKTQSTEELALSVGGNPLLILIKAIISRSLFILLSIWFVSYSADKKDDKYNGIVNIIIVGLLLFSILSSISLVFSRISRYYDIFQILLLPLAYSKANGKYKYIILLIIILYSIVKFISIIFTSKGIYIPYKYVWSL